MTATLTNNWQGSTVVCIGGGPSLTREDVDYIYRKAKVITINDAYRVAPWGDLQYACDLKWWNWHSDKLDHMPRERWTTDREAADKHGLNYIAGQWGDGLSDDPGLIHYGSNSGYQAINIAYLKGASRVLLLGYDMKIATSGASHWFGDHPDKVRSGYERWFKNFDTIAAQNKIEILNVTPDSALPSFKKANLRDVLC